MLLETGLLISFGSYIGGKIADMGFDAIVSNLTKIDEEDKFYKVVTETSKELQEKYPNLLGGSIEHFFKHKDIFGELVKLLFIDAKVNVEVIERHFDVTTLPQGFVLEFVTLLRSKLFVSSDFSQVLSSKEIYLICLGINSNLSGLLDISTMSLDELRSISNSLKEKLDNEFNYETFRKNYFANALNNLSQVNFIGLGVDLAIKKGKRKKIDNIFVRPTFSVPSDNQINISNSTTTNENISSEDHSDDDSLVALFEDHDIDYQQLFSLTANIVILGNPGSGKSFLLRSIICSIIENKRVEFSEKRIFDMLPFRIELRKYLNYKKSSGGNIFSYLIVLLSTEYGIDGLSEKTLKRIFQDKEVIMLYDGLDEIFNITDRIEIKNDIENFTRAYRCVFTLTTSRIIGYDDASLDSQNYLKIHIDNFEDYQIEEYVKKWYEIEEENTTTREKEVAEFFDKIEVVDYEIKSNPLLLSLIVILYRNNLKLPESKLEIYQSCTSTLVDKWDVSKQLSIDLDSEIYKRKETIFADLAYWQYNELSSNDVNKKITFDRAKATVANTIINKLKLADEFTVNVIAENFMDYAHKRSIYFDNNFTHKTFLEYYSAFWIYTNIEKKHKKEDRDNLIAKYISNPFWYIVLELLLNLIDKDQADNEIIDELISTQLNTPKASLVFLLNVFPTLKNISAAQITDILVAAIRWIIDSDYTQSGEVRKFDADNYTRQIGSLLINSLSKNNNNGFDALAIVESNLTEKNKHNYLQFYLEYAIRNDDGFFKLRPIVKYESDIHSDKLLFTLYYIGLNSKVLDDNTADIISSYVQKYGLESALTSEYGHYTRISFFPFLCIALRRLFYKEYLKNLPDALLKLSECGVSVQVIIQCMIDHFDTLIWTDIDVCAVAKEYNQCKDKNVQCLLLLYLYNAVKIANQKRSEYTVDALLQCITNTERRNQIDDLLTQPSYNDVYIKVFKEFGVDVSSISLKKETKNQNGRRKRKG